MLPLFDDNRAKHLPICTLVLILANLGVFIHQLLLPTPESLEKFIHLHALTPGRLFSHPGKDSALSLLTSMFLHGGLLHLAGNLWFLWLFGNNVEDKLGSFKFLIFYLICGLGAAGSQILVAPFSPVPMLGASGAISGILAAYMRLFPWAKVFTLTPLWFAPILPIPAFLFLAGWFVVQTWHGMPALLNTSLSGGVAWWAHIGGFIAGYLLTKFFKKKWL